MKEGKTDCGSRFGAVKRGTWKHSHYDVAKTTRTSRDMSMLIHVELYKLY